MKGRQVDKHVAQVLADYIAGYPAKALPSAARQSASSCILDALTAAIAGLELSSVRCARTLARDVFASGNVPLWFCGECSGLVGAAFGNASAVAALDFDDGHRLARGHPGAAIIPASLAAAASRDVDADEILTAVALGYEIAVRIARAQNAKTIRSRQSGRWTGYGVVAAVGRLQQRCPEALADALSVVGVLAPNQEANGSSGYAELTGNDVKEGIPWSVVTGLSALQLAKQGFTGPADLLDHCSHFDRDTIVKDLTDPTEITRVYFKPYSCCRYIHPALDAFGELLVRFDLHPVDILSIDVETFEWAGRLANRLSPQSLTDIQFSLPYCVAIAAIDGLDALAPIGPAQLGRPDLVEFAQRVRLSIGSDIDARFPGETLARLKINLADGSTIQSSVVGPRGDPQRPMCWDDLCDKFYKAASRQMPSGTPEKVVASVEALKAGDKIPLFEGLSARLVI